MVTADIGDPRLKALFGTTDPANTSVRPVIRLPRKGISPALFAIIVAIVATALFSALNEGRINQTQPRIRAPGSDVLSDAWPDPPPLLIPKPEAASPALQRERPNAQPSDAPVAQSAPTSNARPSPQTPQLPSDDYTGPPPLPSFQPRKAPPTPLLIDGEPPTRASLRPMLDRSSSTPSSPAYRMRSSALANPSLTVAQGSLIRAVLETGFDSTRPGFLRAIVSQDVRSFDGKNVLIPRGSRLIGENRTPAAEGHKSVLITWTRLIRPDGVTMEMDSPATDSAGRGGVPASVNTHLFSQIGSALGKAVDTVSQFLAARAGPLLIVPGIGSSTKPQTPSHSKRPPTLKVAPATSINVFVAHDLDFSSAGEPR